MLNALLTRINALHLLPLYKEQFEWYDSPYVIAAGVFVALYVMVKIFAALFVQVRIDLTKQKGTDVKAPNETIDRVTKEQDFNIKNEFVSLSILLALLLILNRLIFCEGREKWMFLLYGNLVAMLAWEIWHIVVCVKCVKKAYIHLAQDGERQSLKEDAEFPIDEKKQNQGIPEKTETLEGDEGKDKMITTSFVHEITKIIRGLFFFILFILCPALFPFLNIQHKTEIWHFIPAFGYWCIFWVIVGYIDEKMQISSPLDVESADVADADSKKKSEENCSDIDSADIANADSKKKSEDTIWPVWAILIICFVYMFGILRFIQDVYSNNIGKPNDLMFWEGVFLFFVVSLLAVLKGNGFRIRIFSFSLLFIGNFICLLVSVLLLLGCVVNICATRSQRAMAAIVIQGAKATTSSEVRQLTSDKLTSCPDDFVIACDNYALTLENFIVVEPLLYVRKYDCFDEKKYKSTEDYIRIGCEEFWEAHDNAWNEVLVVASKYGVDENGYLK